jgi:glycosyltransferase involved in cell wall biosynthesis
MPVLPRLLFIFNELLRARVAVDDITGGKEAVSGSISSSLIIADLLARRGHQVGVVVLQNGQTAGGHFSGFTSLPKALAWLDGGRAIWCSWGDEETLPHLEAAGCRPLIWLHVPATETLLGALEAGRLAGMVLVSDSVRLPLLHRPCHHRVGRVYNPLNPFFVDDAEANPERYRSPNVVFAGHLSEYKGAHGALQMWQHVRRRLPAATLTLCGSNRLYRENAPLGPFGVADPAFEESYLVPLVREHGSLAAAGIRMAGLLSPAELKQLYHRAALGLVNCNGVPETFSCAGVEMLATGLPVFSFARGSLPETIGRSGGAILATRLDLASAADGLTTLIRAPERLEALGRAGRVYVRLAYEPERLASHWERLLAGDPDHLDRNTGRWGARRSTRYFVERWCARLRLQVPFRWSKALARRLLAQSGSS